MDLLSLINSENWKMLKLYLDHSNTKQDINKDRDQNTLLHILAKKKVTWDYNLVSKLKDFVNINERNSEGKTALHIAIETNNLETAEELIKNGAHVDLPDKRGFSPLYYATIGGNIKVVQLLYANGADLGWKDTRGESALHHAARFDLRTQIAFFLNKKTDINSPNAYGQTPLEVAISARNTKIALVLIGAGANLRLCNKAEGSLLHKTIQMSNFEVSRILVNTLGVAIVDSELRTPLHVATEANQVKIVKMLLDSNASLNSQDIDGYTPLHVAVQNGYLEILDLFIAHAQNTANAELKSVDLTKEKIEICRQKLDYYKKTNAGDNILHLLAASKMAEQNKMNAFYSLRQLNLKKLVVQTNRDFKTPLHFAYQVFCRPLITQFVNLGADVDETDRFGWKAVSYCTLPDGGRMRVIKKESFTRRKVQSAVL